MGTRFLVGGVRGARSVGGVVGEVCERPVSGGTPREACSERGVLGGTGGAVAQCEEDGRVALLGEQRGRWRPIRSFAVVSLCARAHVFFSFFHVYIIYRDGNRYILLYIYFSR